MKLHIIFAETLAGGWKPSGSLASAIEQVRRATRIILQSKQVPLNLTGNLASKLIGKRFSMGNIISPISFMIQSLL